MRRLPFRALEMHGQRMWERDKVVRTLRFMQRHGLNALVLHEPDLVHQVVYPRRYFDPYALWTDLPTRRGENAMFNRRAYLDHVLRLAADHGIAVYVNVKEIGFSDEVLALRPEVFKDGAVCPSEPFWTEYVAAKADELFGDFPLLAGMIVSFGSQESRASRAQNRCRCELCRGEPLARWYGRLIEALHAPAARHGRRLAVRDFAYRPADHAPLVEAMASAPADVVFCLKAMPHDFYVTFPDNPAIGRLSRTQWFEYDVMGQFFGWGVMPCLVRDDLRARLARFGERIDGVVLRIEWERINDLDALDTLAEVNLVAAAALAGGDDLSSEAACESWLAGHGYGTASAPWLAGILDATLPVVRGAAYTDGFVSADNSMLPRSVQRAWWGMETRDALVPWDASRAGDLALDRARAAQVLAEKREALAAARSLVARLRAPAPGVEVALKRYVEQAFAHYELWVEGLAVTAAVCIHCRWLGQAGADATPADVAAFADALAALAAYVPRAQAVVENPSVPHQVAMLVDHRRALDVLRDGHAAADALRPRTA